ncbi:methyltransferase domain-containing protein [Streptomyces sp. NPDC006274]|uniref:protein-L-isoaspartate O-methyltransferase family protein n=1 Tax=unclassified Streptomyces TaxID=2593676 RepID=UPI0033A28C99
MVTTQTDGYAALVDDLQERGLLDDEWAPVWRAVRRDTFIPDQIWRQEPDHCEPITSREDWLALVHSDLPVVTQLDDGQEDGPGIATSSNSQPSMVATMLDLLRVESGQRVLEIGTATGHVAALLCERLGEEHVYSIEIDPVLAKRAAVALHTAGYMPQLRCGDGEAGWSDAEPFDRLLSTCALRHIPMEFVRQVRPEGLIVAPLVRDFWSGALVQLQVDEDGSASGRFRSGASYMPMRSHRQATDVSVDDSTARPRPPATDLPRLLELGFAVYAGARLPGVSMWHTEEAGGVQVWALAEDGSAARAATGEDVWQYGPQSLWEEIERVHGEYLELGSPAASSFGMTVTPDRQWVWLGQPRVEVAPEP